MHINPTGRSAPARCRRGRRTGATRHPRGRGAVVVVDRRSRRRHGRRRGLAGRTGRRGVLDGTVDPGVGHDVVEDVPHERCGGLRSVASLIDDGEDEVLAGMKAIHHIVVRIIAISARTPVISCTVPHPLSISLNSNRSKTPRMSMM